MKKLLFILFCLPLFSFGQWSTVYTNSSGSGTYTGNVWRTVNALEVSDGGFVLLGAYNSWNHTSAHMENWSSVYGYRVLKTDYNGIEEWKIEDYCLSHLNSNDPFIAPIEMGVTKIGDIFLLLNSRTKIINQQGSTLFNEPNQCLPMFDWYKDGKIIKISDSTYTIYCSNFLITLDINFNYLWSVNVIQSNSIISASDGGYFFIGKDNDSLFLNKSNEFGDSLWSRKYYFSENDVVKDIIQTIDGGCLIVGGISKLGNERDILLIKTNAFGDTLWTRIYGDQYNDIANSVIETSSGDFVVIGTKTTSFLGFSEVYLLAIDSLGNKLWEKSYGGELSKDKGISVAQTTDGGFIIGAEKSDKDIWLIKTDANGVTATNEISQEKPKGELLKIVDVLGRETKPKSNNPFIEIYENGTVEKRIIIE